ncbi:acetylornithine aminotransferase [Tieghemiomyces parasiticus]|uniref:acetylornithine transaminase n=1 Tax=Tieghemiomyces parasiticus TaxID=78921 RepID=A0A9W8A9Q7_9FUNG|nr:acetylornithine aminotransferase [Tieghemiomyces parasiticus]
MLSRRLFTRTQISLARSAARTGSARAPLATSNLAARRALHATPAPRANTTARTTTSTLTHADTAASAETRATIDRFQRYTLGTYVRPPLVLTHGEGCWVFDSDGRKFLDFTAGIAVNALGHADPEVARILHHQAQRMVHMSNLYHNEWAGELAEVLVESTIAAEQARSTAPAAVGEGASASTATFHPSKVFFANSGTEANEGALKFAKKYGNLQREAHPDRYPQGKHEVLAFSRGFHGRSMGALSATAAPAYQAPFQPLVPGFTHTPYNDVAAAEAAIHEGTCAVIVEPIQGEGGVHMATPEFLRALRRRCDAVGALLIYDEIQCGLGRTGQLWGFQHYPADCRPDLVTMAKPLANGIPIGAVLLTDETAAKINPGDHGTTFGGNPLACRVGLHVLQRIRQPEFLAQVRATGAHLKAQAERQLLQAFPDLVTGVRGVGMMVGIQMNCNPAPLVDLARERGLLIITAGGNTVRLVPSLTLTADEADQGIRILADSLRAFQAQQTP